MNTFRSRFIAVNGRTVERTTVDVRKERSAKLKGGLSEVLIEAIFCIKINDTGQLAAEIEPRLMLLSTLAFLLIFSVTQILVY